MRDHDLSLRIPKVLGTAVPCLAGRFSLDRPTHPSGSSQPNEGLPEFVVLAVDYLKVSHRGDCATIVQMDKARAHEA